VADEAKAAGAGHRNVERQRFPGELHEGSRRGVKEFGTASYFEFGHTDRLSDVGADDSRDLLAAGGQRGRSGLEPRDPLMARLLPVSGECGARRLYRPIDICGTGFHDTADRLSVLRRDKIEGRALSLYEFAVDEGRVKRQVRFAHVLAHFGLRRSKICASTGPVCRAVILVIADRR